MRKKQSESDVKSHSGADRWTQRKTTRAATEEKRSGRVKGKNHRGGVMDGRGGEEKQPPAPLV